ncbi:MAG: LamG domain-containing protein [Bythopirellula sp.]
MMHYRNSKNLLRAVVKKTLFGVLMLAGVLIGSGIEFATLAAAREQKPLWSWSFDQPSERPSVLGSTGDSAKQHGNFRLVQGVRGKSLLLDGLTTFCSIPDTDLVRLRTGFTVEAWVAHQTYSWAQTAIVDASIDQETGFLFGTDVKGRPLLFVAINGEWIGCVAKDSAPLLQWAHLVATFHQEKGLQLYLDGRLVGSREASGQMTTERRVEMLLGLSRKPLEPVNAVDQLDLTTPMLFDGLIDEVQVFDRALSADEIGRRFTDVKPSPARPLNWRRMPTGPEGSGPFGAHYTKLRYSPGWDDYWRSGPDSDVLVRFDRSPAKMMFWRGTNYGAVWIAENGLMMGDQSLERAGAGKSPWGCCEHMSDKQCRYSSVRVVESNEARAVIHWRYAVSDVKYQIFGEDPISTWGEWAEEYYVVYPDGVSTRKQTLWSKHLSHEWQETIPLHQPGKRPEDTLDDPALTLANMEGQTHSYSWVDGSTLGPTKPVDATIQLTNLRSKYRPFLILEPGATIKIKQGVDFRERGTHYQWWNHWPVAQAPSPGTHAVTHDRPSHSHLTQTIEESPPPVIVHDRRKHTFTAVHLIGMTNQPITGLIPLARSWNFPPELKVTSGDFAYDGYDKYQRAYILSSSTSDEPPPLVVHVDASDKSPLVNPAVVIKQWGDHRANVTVNGRQLETRSDVRTALRSGLDGIDLVVWLSLEATQPLEMTFQPGNFVRNQ